ncbi:hypothetical protein Krac_1732 [Ktedonobacter racemifer DSM 44963]|uniref:Uncharacterized protein n=1 Tax=Ktedonobacter racemifer DSM 44963 TaxID=485913 RepID=D6U354_KTERA|nr:hypothetical protein Krac_1732 [Ktedonobacter racemifer DSM 44963]
MGKPVGIGNPFYHFLYFHAFLCNYCKTTDDLVQVSFLSNMILLLPASFSPLLSPRFFLAPLTTACPYAIFCGSSPSHLTEPYPV